MTELSSLDKWVTEKQPQSDHDYYKGWWDSVEFIRRLIADYPLFEFTVVDTFMMDTPPPTTMLPMPLSRGKSQRFEVLFKESWVVEPDWTVSISRKETGRIELYGFLKEIGTTNKWLLRGMDKRLIYPPYNDVALKFSGSVKNKYLLYGLFQILEQMEKN